MFRFQIERDSAGRKRPVDHLFLSVARRDPPQPFLARFAGEQPDVSPASAATILRPGGAVTHARLGGRGVIFNVGRVEWQDADTAFVWGGYYITSEGGAGYMHLVQRRSGHWVVTGAWMRWIS